MRFSRITKFVLILALAALVFPVATNLAPRVHAYPPYSLTPVPASTAEGNTVGLALSNAGAVQNIQYRFRFFVTDPSGMTVQSIQENYTTVPGQYSFSMQVNYPGLGFQGSNTLVGQYNVKVDELWPTAAPGVAGASFNLTITDSPSYQRTQTVNVHAAGYNASETVAVTIRTQTNSTLVYSALVAASSSGVIVTNWKSPRNAIIDTYIVTLAGTNTVKKTPDTAPFSVRAAVMTIGSVTSLRSTYLRTQRMNFSFQPTYPDGSIPSAGIAILILTSASGSNTTLTATYSSMSQTLNATFLTSLSDPGGTWTASLGRSAYSDAYGNSGPGTTISVSVPVAFDTASKSWLGTYTIQPSDVGGQWSLIVRASDAPTPPNTGYASRIITVQNTTTGASTASFPLYYFGIIAALIAAALTVLFLVIRRRRPTQTSLKIDLGAVQSEAGRIESSDFFQSVRDQVKKEKDEK